MSITSDYCVPQFSQVGVMPALEDGFVFVLPLDHCFPSGAATRSRGSLQLVTGTERPVIAAVLGCSESDLVFIQHAGSAGYRRPDTYFVQLYSAVPRALLRPLRDLLCASIPGLTRQCAVDVSEYGHMPEHGPVVEGVSKYCADKLCRRIHEIGVMTKCEAAQ